MITHCPWCGAPAEVKTQPDGTRVVASHDTGSRYDSSRCPGIGAVYHTSSEYMVGLTAALAIAAAICLAAWLLR